MCSWKVQLVFSQINLGNVNMGFIPCIYLYKPVSIYLSLYVSTHTLAVVSEINIYNFLFLKWPLGLPW